MSGGHVPISLQRRVRQRAADRCEYCRLSQEGQEATFHVDHIRPRREDGPTEVGNLALACVSCSLRKGAGTTATDPESGEVVRLFNPRANRWEEHFEPRADGTLVGRTAIGRATVDLLWMNRPLAIAIRIEEMERGRYP